MNANSNGELQRRGRKLPIVGIVIATLVVIIGGGILLLQRTLERGAEHLAEKISNVPTLVDEMARLISSPVPANSILVHDSTTVAVITREWGAEEEAVAERGYRIYSGRWISRPDVDWQSVAARDSTTPGFQQALRFSLVARDATPVDTVGYLVIAPDSMKMPVVRIRGGH